MISLKGKRMIQPFFFHGKILAWNSALKDCSRHDCDYHCSSKITTKTKEVMHAKTIKEEKRALWLIPTRTTFISPGSVQCTYFWMQNALRFVTDALISYNIIWSQSGSPTNCLNSLARTFHLDFMIIYGYLRLPSQSYYETVTKVHRMAMTSILTSSRCVFTCCHRPFWWNGMCVNFCAATAMYVYNVLEVVLKTFPRISRYLS